MNQDDAIALLRDAVVALSGLADDHVLLGYGPQVPRLATGHIYLISQGDARIGFPRQSTLTVVNQSRLADVRLEAVGYAACAALRVVHALLWSQHDAVRALSAAGVSTHELGDVIDVSVPVTTAYEPRCLFDAAIGYVLSVASAAGPEATAINLSTEAAAALVVAPVEVTFAVP